MSGVISAGSTPAAEAGAEILRAGGNAVDAAVAACFAVCAGEPTLTSLAGGGMMLIRHGGSGDVRIIDFFGNAPRLKQSDVDGLDFYNIDLNYGPTTQRFYVGAGAAGVPGSIPGLCTAAERFGSMSLADITAPACALLRHGAVLGSRQADLADFLKPILINKPASREIFAPRGRFIKAGDLFKLPDLADTIESLGRDPWRDAYRERVESAFVAQCGPSQGGLLQQEDFDSYEVIEREPLTMSGPNGAIFTVPAPAAGGPMISLMRKLVVNDVSAGFERVRVLCAAMATADEVRVADRLEEANASLDLVLDRYQARLVGALEAASAPGGPACTTHISVVDSLDNAVGVTLSHGESNAQLIEGTGILMNNFLGEDDLLPRGLGTATPGRRLATMMSPTLVSMSDGRIHVLGTGGSNRIRTAILQVIGRLLDDGHLPQDAVDAPRIHYEAGVLNAELFGDISEPLLRDLAGDRVVRFDGQHLFFGGVQLASKLSDGTLCGGGDPRRGGHVIIV